MSHWIGRVACIALAGISMIPRPGAAQSSEIVALYEEGEVGGVLKALPDSAFDTMSLPDQLLLLRAAARGGAGHYSKRRLPRVLAKRPRDPDVLATAAVVAFSTGDMAGARSHARAASKVDRGQVEAWRVEAMLRVHQNDPRGALAAYRASHEAAPELVGSFWDLLIGRAVAVANRDAGLAAEVNEARARRLSAAGDQKGARTARERAALYRAEAGRPLFAASTEDDVVVLPFTSCWEGGYYRCVDVTAGGTSYRTLLDSGNQTGFDANVPALERGLATRVGGGATLTMGAVDTALAAHDFFAATVRFGGLAVRNVPALASSKPREPWFDANLNPFFLNERVVTLDYVRGRFIVRTKERFDHDMSTAPTDGMVRVPVFDPDRPYVLVDVNGHPATAVIETGSSVLDITREFATAAGLPLRDGTRKWRDQLVKLKRTDVDVRIGGMPFFADSVEVWPGRVYESASGLLYDVIIGPGALEGRYSLTYDPFHHVVVLERRAAWGVS